MTEEQILKECNTRYPIGTKYYCAKYGGIEEAKYRASIVTIYDNKFSVEVGRGYCHYYGEWAKILEEES